MRLLFIALSKRSTPPTAGLRSFLSYRFVLPIGVCERWFEIIETIELLFQQISAHIIVSIVTYIKIAFWFLAYKILDISAFVAWKLSFLVTLRRLALFPLLQIPYDYPKLGITKKPKYPKRAIKLCAVKKLSNVIIWLPGCSTFASRLRTTDSPNPRSCLRLTFTPAYGSK